MLALERRHLDLGAERGLREAERHLADDVVVLAAEERVLADADHDVEVARRAAAAARLAFAAQLQARAGVDAGGDLHAEGLRAADDALPLALGDTGSPMTLPCPLHWPQVLAMVKKPCWKRTWPEPRQPLQVFGVVPGLAPLPVAGLAGRQARDA